MKLALAFAALAIFASACRRDVALGDTPDATPFDANALPDATAADADAPDAEAPDAGSSSDAGEEDAGPVTHDLTFGAAIPDGPPCTGSLTGRDAEFTALAPSDFGYTPGALSLQP